jgi:hypothetical protein
MISLERLLEGFAVEEASRQRRDASDFRIVDAQQVLRRREQRSRGA